MPQQLGVGVSGGCEIKVIGAKLKIEEAQRDGTHLVLVCLDLKNAHNEYCRAGAQAALDEHGQQDDCLKHLAQAHRADCGHHGDVYMRSSSSPTGFTKICESTAGGPQGSPITNLAFPIIDNQQGSEGHRGEVRGGGNTLHPRRRRHHRAAQPHFRSPRSTQLSPQRARQV